MSDYLVSLARRAKFGERNASRKLAMIALCNAANDDGDAIVMAADEIAEAAELLDVKSAMRVRKELVAVGLIAPADDEDDEPKAGHGRGAKGRYSVNVGRLKALFDGEWDYAAEAAPLRRRKGGVTPPYREARVASDHPKQNGPLQPDHPKDHPIKGGALGGAKGGATPQTPLTVGEVSNNISPPLTPPDGERERESAIAFEQVLHDLRTAKPQCARAIDKLIDPLLRQRRLHGAPDPVFALGTIAEWAEKHPDDVLADALERVKTARGFSFKQADLEHALKAAIASAKRTAPLHRRGASADADADVVAMGARVREALRSRLGNDVFNSWFAGLEFERFAEGRLVASVGVKFMRSYIEQNFASDLEACARGVFAGVERIDIVVRQAEKQHA